MRLIANLKEESDSAVAKSETKCQKSTSRSTQKCNSTFKDAEGNSREWDSDICWNFAAMIESEDLNVEEVIPPKPITAYHYDVNDHFQLEPLRDMLRNQKVVGHV